MPKVGKMKFPYTEQGIRDAQNYSKQSGKPMQVEGNYRHGGMVKPMRPMYKHGGKVMPKYEGGGIVREKGIIERLADLAALYRNTGPEIVVKASDEPFQRNIGKAEKKKPKRKTKKRRY